MLRSFRLLLLPTALVFASALGGAAPVFAQRPADPVDLAIAQEFGVRTWAISLAAGDAAGREFVAALCAADWRARRAAMDALGRAASGLRGSEREAQARRQVQLGLVDAHPNVQVAALRALDALGGVWLVDEAPWRALAAADMPGVRLGLVRVLTYGLASLDPALASTWSDADKLRSAKFSALRLELLLGDDNSGLVFDADPGVRGAARQAFFIAELPADSELGSAFRRERIELLHGLVLEHKVEELSVLLRVIARTTPDLEFLNALSEWATWLAAERSADLLRMGILPQHFQGLIEATRSTAGGGCDVSILVPAFADWVWSRANSPLEFDSWRAVDDIYTSGIRAGGEELLRALLSMAARPQVGGAFALSPQAGTRSAESDSGDLGEVRRELLQGAVDSNRPSESLALGAEIFKTPGMTTLFVDQFSGGFDAAHLGAALAWTKPGLAREFNLPLSVVEAVSTHHVFHPSTESENFLLGVMEWDDYASLETAFRALCDARWSEAERFGLNSDEVLFQGLFTGFNRIWKMSRGVRLDILIKLPHVPEVVIFAPLVVEVGDAAGRTADYRGQCVELLGSCEGSQFAADVLTRWMHEELDLIASDGGDGPLTRAQELELAGYARAFAGIGFWASDSDLEGETLTADRELCRESLEVLLELSRGRSDELGKHVVAALAKFEGGLELLAEEYLDETGAVDRRARIEAGVVCIQGGVETEAAIAELLRDYGAIGWDLRDRVIRAVGYSGGEVSLQFLIGLIDKGLEEHDGLVTREELNSAIDVLAWRAAMHASLEGENARGEVLIATAFDALTRVARDASNIESRGMGISRIGSLLAELRRAEVPRGEAGDDAFACLEGFAKTSLLLGALADDEVEYLMDKSTLALAESLGKSLQPEWLQERVLEGPLQVAREDLVVRWRGSDPGEREFTNRGSVDLWRALGDVTAVIDGPGTGDWHGADGRLLGTMAHLIEGEEPELAARLYVAAVVALEGESTLDREIWTETVGRQFGLAWRHGEWQLASNLIERLVMARRRGTLSDAGFRLVFGTRSAAFDIWPVARLESLRFQARARLAMDAKAASILAKAAGSLVGASSAARADQAALLPR